METDRHLWLAAQILLVKHGPQALAIARRHAHEWIQREDAAAASLWEGIAHRVSDLASGKFPATLQEPVADRLQQDEVERMMRRSRQRRRQDS